MPSIYPRILSRPINILWAGWETNTRRLQAAGWQLSAYEDIAGRYGSPVLAVAFKHPTLRVSGVTRLHEWRYNVEFDPRVMYGTDTGLNLEAHDMGVRQRTVIPPPRYHDEKIWFDAIDARPVFSEEPVQRLEDYAHFKYIERDAKQIFLDETSAEELVELAMERQKPVADKMRKRLLEDREIARNSKLQAELRLIA